MVEIIKDKKSLKKISFLNKIKRKSILFISFAYNSLLYILKINQVILFKKNNREFLSILKSVGNSNVEKFVTPHWNNMNRKMRDYIGNRGLPIDFLRDKTIGYTMFLSTDKKNMKTELIDLHNFYGENDLKYFLKEEMIGFPIITDYDHMTSSNSTRHLHHIAHFSKNTNINIKNINSVIEWGGGYGNFARIFLKVRERSFVNSKENNKQINYTIIDTPLFSCIQWLYLSTVLGKDKVNIIKDKNDKIDQNKVNIVPISFVDSIDFRPDLFVSTWALSESSPNAQDHVVSKNFWNSKHTFIIYQSSNEELPYSGRLGDIEIKGRNLNKSLVKYVSHPTYYLID